MKNAGNGIKYKTYNTQIYIHVSKYIHNLHLAWLWMLPWTTRAVFSVGKTIGTKAQDLLDGVERVCVVSADGFERETVQIFPRKRWRKDSTNHGFICLPSAAPVEVRTWIMMSYSRQQLNRPCEDSTCLWNKKQSLDLCVFSPCMETITMAALSCRYMQSVRQLCLVIGS